MKDTFQKDDLQTFANYARQHAISVQTVYRHAETKQINSVEIDGVKFVVID